jgi:hypothetical protein
MIRMHQLADFGAVFGLIGLHCRVAAFALHRPPLTSL